MKTKCSKLSLMLAMCIAISLVMPGIMSSLAAPPANDNFADATIISALPFEDWVDNTEATIEPDEPQSACFMRGTIWYQYTPTADAVILADMAGGNIWNTCLNAYMATGPNMADLVILLSSGVGGYIILPVRAGTTYYFQAGSIEELGLLHVGVQEIPPPPNDDFADAAVIAALPFSERVDTPPQPSRRTSPGRPASA